jgi:hypothetical protein
MIAMLLCGIKKYFLNDPHRVQLPYALTNKKGDATVASPFIFKSYLITIY